MQQTVGRLLSASRALPPHPQTAAPAPWPSAGRSPCPPSAQQGSTCTNTLWHGKKNAGKVFSFQAGLQCMLHARTTTTGTTSHEPACPATDAQLPHPAHLAGELRATLLLEAGQQALLVVLASCITSGQHGARTASSSERQGGMCRAGAGNPSSDVQRNTRHRPSRVAVYRLPAALPCALPTAGGVQQAAGQLLAVELAEQVLVCRGTFTNGQPPQPVLPACRVERDEPIQEHPVSTTVHWNRPAACTENQEHPTHR